MSVGVQQISTDITVDLTGSQERTASAPFSVASQKEIPAGVFLQRHPNVLASKHHLANKH